MEVILGRALRSAPAASLNLRACVLRRIQEVKELAGEWKDLLARSCANEPMLSAEWLLTWWSIFGSSEGRRLCFVTFRRGDRLVGLAPLLSRRHWYRSVIPFRRLEPFGSGERERDAICSDYLNVIAECDEEPAIAGKLVSMIVAGECGSWDEFLLPMMNGESAMPALLQKGFQSRGFQADIVPMGEAPYIRLPSSWEDFLKGLAKKHRYALVRSLRDFSAWAGADVQINQVASIESLATGKAILQALHTERWQKSGHGGRFGSSRFTAFHDTIMTLLQGEDALELLWLSVRGQPIAAQYNLVWNGKVYFYQCGRRVDVPDHIRPGQVLLTHAIRRAIAAGRREFDFLNGAAQYKMQLATAVRPLVGVRAARRCMAESLHHWTEQGMHRLRKLRRLIRLWCSANKP